MHLYIPTYNSANFLKNLQIDPRFTAIIVDNCSEDETVSIAKNKGWQVVMQKKHCDRVKNWEFAAEHFLNSKASWAKWLFTGDNLLSTSFDILTNAVKSYPEAKLIVAEYKIVTEKEKHLWSQFDSTELIMPKRALQLACLKGNWFGAPIAQAFHRDAVAKGFTFGSWHWVADMQFFLSMSKHSPVLYLKETIGQFNAAARKVFSKEQNALTSSVEEFLIRQQSAKDWFALTQNQAEYQKLLQHISQETEKTILQRAIDRAYSDKNTLHFLKYKLLSKLI